MANGIKLTPASQKLLDGLVKAGKIDMRPTLDVIGIGYRKEVGAIFDKKQPRQAGLSWAPLSEKYARWKEVHYPGQPILVRTGVLKQSMTTKGARGNISAVSKFSAVFGSSIRYAIYHDEGRGLPMRNFSEPSERREAIWMEQIREDIIRNFEKNGIKVEGGIFA